MKTKYTQRQDGEWFPFPRNLTLVCCDCGLAHDIVVRVKNGKVKVQFTRNKRRTAAVRRGKRIRKSFKV